MSGLMLETKAGDSLTFDIAVTNSDGSVTDLTGAAIEWKVAPVLAAGATVYGDPVVSLSLASGISVPSSGVIRIAAGAGAIPAGRWVHECKVTFAGGTRETVAHGALIAYPSI